MPMRSLDEPKLQPFLPLIYLAWEDSDLTPDEVSDIHATVCASALDTATRDALALWLDPSHPPTPNELHALRRATNPAATTDDATVTTLRTLERELGVTRPTSQRDRPAATLDREALAATLDGKYRATREATRALLARLRPLPEAGLEKKEQRDRVRRWLGDLARAGVGEKAYPTEGNGLGEFIAVFETVASFDLSLVVKLGVQFGLFGGSIYFLGGEAQRATMLPSVASLELPGCFAMSELGHGSNVRDLKTVARYDATTRTFDIHTPSEDARKEWIGGAAEDARIATVFAQLEIDGESRGVHAFLVPVRDNKMQLTPGVRIEDCGEKMGLNGVDNGRIWFDHVRVSRDALLHRYASIDDEGRYQSAIASDAKRFFTMLGTLVGGRVSVAGAGLCAAKKALTIAIRYADVRRQFGPPDAPETLLLDYPTHQRRLLPLLAEVYALHFAHERLVERYENRTEADEREVEALAAGLKSVATWFTTRTIQACREACGGQGYLAINELTALKADTDVFTTFEGDNTVLMQLVAKSLLTEFRSQFADNKVMAMVRHLARRARTAIAEQNPVATRRVDATHLRDRAFQLAALRFRESSLLSSVATRLRKRITGGEEATLAFNAVQTHLVALAHAHVERVVLESASERVAGLDASLREPLDTVLDLYALTRIETDLAWFLENNYLEPTKSRAIRKEVDALCASLRTNAVPLVDALSVPTTAPIAG